MPKWDAVARRAAQDANTTLPLDGRQVAEMARQCAAAYQPETPAERSLLETTYTRAFTQALAARAAERGAGHVLPGDHEGDALMTRIERERWG